MLSALDSHLECNYTYNTAISIEAHTHEFCGRISASDFLSLQSYALEYAGHCVSYVLVDKENEKPNASEHSLFPQRLDHTGTI